MFDIQFFSSLNILLRPHKEPFPCLVQLIPADRNNTFLIQHKICSGKFPHSHKVYDEAVVTAHEDNRIQFFLQLGQFFWDVYRFFPAMYPGCPPISLNVQNLFFSDNEFCPLRMYMMQGSYILQKEKNWGRVL